MLPRDPRAPSSPNVRLAALGLLGLGIYALAFVGPYSLAKWWRTPGLTVVIISHGDFRAAAAYVAAVLALFGLYFLAVQVARGRQPASTWVVATACTLALNAALLAMYPVESVDVFDNIIRGRLQSHYGANPFYEVPMDFPGDPFLAYSAWRWATTAYGPLWELIAGGLTRVTGNGVVANVLAFKLLSVGAYLATAALIALTLRRLAPERALAGALLYAWNPLVLYSTAGGGHNDAVMVLGMALGMYLLARGRFTLAALAQTAGALVKFIPALLVPVAVVVALRRLDGWQARARYLLVTGAACAALVVAAYALYWQPGASVADLLSVERRTKLFTTSLPTLASVALTPRLGEDAAQATVSKGAALLLLAWTALELRGLWQRRDDPAPARAGASILVFYLLVACLWFQPWYVAWPLALAALLPDGALLRGTLLLSLSAMGKMPIFDFAVVHGGPLPPVAQREWPLTLGTLGAPLLYFGWVALRAAWQRTRRPRAVPAPSPVALPGRPAAVPVADEGDEQKAA